MSAVMENIMGDNAKPAAGAPAAARGADAANEAKALTPAPAAAQVRPARRRIAAGGVFMRIVPPLLGVAVLVLVWQIIALKNSSFPTPLATLQEALNMFSDPFYRNSPNDQGIGWNVLASLQRVGVGFGLAALVGIPLGFAIGRVQFLAAMFGPIISLLKPVSPLAWLPIGLLVFKSANPAAIWSIFICSIWPMIINTAVGVQRVPQDYMNVARVLNLPEWKILTKILFPSVLPYMLTGVRLSIGTAWLVIVAAEMLTGGVGIGFWVWDEWNNLNVPHIIIAIVVIGVVGLILEQALVALAKAFTYEQVSN
ncbi:MULTISPECIES: nitrate ABC transporter permease [unclassified Herbaspirillum]|uniref:nitrate ABC transporter permease n=1 Tax=unclassified Herbaspirillum TaxID=2624150 RepID=UPI001150FB38|nr:MULTISPECIES: nitrate ABC transporter permease [unclassified Herbaspirillum]MBB5391681.1 nitrate/nitrite transport system permease protein [Herbaspirillum sp. SJZ102]TQK03072.1 nitrate/nitrite transport system permease protein [Herbaspirillum sp. SJZ130]TQK06540.1 nitrate/nitrite transport system permease protein [Herbaspirillum sp. SJZ106]TWC62400.1 nitrate/nitrite transport system permease protein [Herbaspirillum sp. SJZ099]